MFPKATSPLDRLVQLLREALDTCYKSSETGDSGQASRGIFDVVEILESLHETQQSDLENASSKEEATVEALSELHHYLSSPSSNQMVVEMLSLELPRVVVKFSGVSNECRKLAEGIIDCLISACSPRDMLSIICEALDSLIRVSHAPIWFVLLLKGLSKVFRCIIRRHAEQVKVALPIVLKVLHGISLESDEEDNDSLFELFSAAIGIAKSIQAVCEKMEGRKKEGPSAILGLYVIQNMAIISRSNLAYKVSDCVPFVVELSHFLPFCGLSYLGLITGCNVDEISSAFFGEDGDEFKTCFSFVKDGACLAVIWGYISDEVSKAAKEQMATVLSILQGSQTKRWQAVGMLKCILSCNDYPLVIKTSTVELLSSIINTSVSDESIDDTADLTSYMPSLFSALQAIERVIIYSSDANLRKTAYAALKKVVLDIPCSLRFDMLKALITNSNSPSMIALLLDLVKEQVFLEKHQRVLPRSDEAVCSEDREPSSQFWSSSALQLVELVLKPPNGGPPSLPEQSEPVLSALNLYRFILMIESAGQAKCKRNDVLSKNALQKAYAEWLRPLRTLVSGIEAENREDTSDVAVNIICALNPVQLVLYHCIELVEANLKSLK